MLRSKKIYSHDGYTRWYSSITATPISSPPPIPPGASVETHDLFINHVIGEDNKCPQAWCYEPLDHQGGTVWVPIQFGDIRAVAGGSFALSFNQVGQPAWVTFATIRRSVKYIDSPALHPN
jgi:hypothetical protein